MERAFPLLPARENFALASSLTLRVFNLPPARPDSRRTRTARRPNSPAMQASRPPSPGRACGKERLYFISIFRCLPQETHGRCLIRRTSPQAFAAGTSPKTQPFQRSSVQFRFVSCLKCNRSGLASSCFILTRACASFSEDFSTTRPLKSTPTPDRPPGRNRPLWPPGPFTTQPMTAVMSRGSRPACTSSAVLIRSIATAAAGQ